MRKEEEGEAGGDICSFWKRARLARITAVTSVGVKLSCSDEDHRRWWIDRRSIGGDKGSRGCA